MRKGERNILNTIISRIKTMKLRTPPLVPYFQVLSIVVAAISSAIAKETRRRLKKTNEIMVAISFTFALLRSVIVKLDGGING